MTQVFFFLVRLNRPDIAREAHKKLEQAAEVSVSV